MSSRTSGPSSHTNLIGKAAIHVLRTLLISFLLCQPTLAYEQEVKQLSARMAEVITKSGKKTVAVVDFTDLQGNVTELGRFLAEEFSVGLASDAKDFEVIDRTNLRAILQEHKLASTGVIDTQTARRLGEIAGVQALVTGNITPFGDSVRLSVKVLDAATARVISGFSADIPRTKAIEELLAKGISSTSSITTPENNPPPPTGSGTQAALQKEDSFSFELKGCERSGATIACRVSIINQGEDMTLMVGGHAFGMLVALKSSRMFDGAGNEYPAAMVRLGNKENNAYVQSLLVSGVPISLTLTFEKVMPDANKVTLLEIGCYRFGENSYKGKGFSVQMRNIPLVR